MMKISRYGRKFNDPWGNKHGNACGSPCRLGYLVGRSELNDEHGERLFGISINLRGYYVDRLLSREGSSARYVRARRSVEKTKR